jgi:hypothetical protein
MLTFSTDGARFDSAGAVRNLDASYRIQHLVVQCLKKADGRRAHAEAVCHEQPSGGETWGRYRMA